MTNPKFKTALIISIVVSFIVCPALLVAAVFYYMFSGISTSLLFNSIKIEMMGTDGFSFSMGPQFLLMLLGLFVLTFFVSFLLIKGSSNINDRNPL